MADTFGEAYFKSQEAAKMTLPQKGSVLISISNADKPSLEEIGRGFHKLGFSIFATHGTARSLKALGIPCTAVDKLGEGSSDILNLISGSGSGKVDIIVNTPTGGQSAQDGSYIRKAAIKHKIAYVTTTPAAKAAIKGIASTREGDWMRVKSLQEYHS
jgi:carbamoyl-phosphate synthase large subunit